MSHFEINRTTNDGTVLYFQGWQSERLGKAVVCLVHGLGEHSGRYAHVAAALNEAGYHVMALDLRGHGKTEGKRGNLPGYDVIGKDVSMLLTEATSRYPTLPQIIYGHSLGGIIVLYYCLRFKPRPAGVVVTSPGLRTALEEQKNKILMVKLLGKVMPGMTISSGLDATAISRDPEVVERYQKDLLVHDQASLGLAKHSLDAIRYIYENGRSWDLPLLLMHGLEDKLAYSEGSVKFAELVKPELCTLRLWEGCAHELHNEPEKEEVLAYLINQLDQFVAREA
jgi:alpha-beta hydrolase superfamily lysophospholipase